MSWGWDGMSVEERQRRRIHLTDGYRVEREGNFQVVSGSQAVRLSQEPRSQITTGQVKTGRPTAVVVLVTYGQDRDISLDLVRRYHLPQYLQS